MYLTFYDSLVVLGVLTSIVLTAYIRSRNKDQANSNISRPPFAFSILPWVGNALDYKKRAVLWLRDSEAAHGPVFRSRILGKQVIFCLSRPLISQIFRNYADFSFTPIKTDAHHRIFGVSQLAVSDEEGQKTMFAELYRVLAKKAIGPLVGHISANLETRLLDVIRNMNSLELQSGKVFNLMELVPPLFYAASSQGMFGDRFPADTIFSSNKDFEDQFGLMYAGLPFPLLVRRGTMGRDRCIALVKSSLAQYESGDAQPPYFIQVMLDLRHTLGWSSQDLAAYLHSYLFALTSNTIYAAYWLVVYTYTHPEVLPELRAEVNAAERKFLVENPSESSTGLFSNLGYLDGDFPLLNSLINETLRLCSNGTSVRKVMNDTVMNVPARVKSDSLPGTRSRLVLFRKGDLVYMPNRFHHLNPDEFDDPETFQPKRFMPDSKKPAGFFIPFGGGISVCSGRFLASAELKALMIILVRSFDAEYEGLVDASGKRIEIQEKLQVPSFDTGSGSAILHPMGDMLLRLKPRAKDGIPSR